MISLVVLLGAGILAQSPSGQLNGTVCVDTSVAVMPGVSIALRGAENRSTVTNREGAFGFSALSGADGQFRIGHLKAGSYSATFSRAGFWMVRRENVVLTNEP